MISTNILTYLEARRLKAGKQSLWQGFRTRWSTYVVKTHKRKE